MNKTILVTGAAGFIGFHLSKRLLNEGWTVVGLDSINDYYDVNLKYARLAELGVERETVAYGVTVSSSRYEGFSFVQGKLEDAALLASVFEAFAFGSVCNLAAQAGVRYSIENPMAYVNSNIVGFTNILEQSRLHSVEHLVYASSSSVYGLNRKMPFSTHDAVNHPVSFYAATKKANELMAHVYSKLYNLPTTGLRFFTVYGPWGRPDMSPMLFADAIMNDRPIKVFNHGEMGRDFTYIDDIIEGVVRVIGHPAEALPEMLTGSPEGQGSGDFPLDGWDPEQPDPATSSVPYKVYNIGSSSPVRLLDYIETMETCLDKKATKEMLPMQPGDVLETFCDVSDLENELGYRPSTPLKEGLQEFADWYRNFYTFMV